ncbi:MAG TPA: hypothetical protein DDZ51_18885 [Planctomycetaceae bacterium]|nr:hypothetical protein [Planctomycetaceae bacterium]
MSWTLKLLVACMLAGTGGCASLTDHHYEQTQRARAREAWRQHGAKCRNPACEKDYAAGWKDGFYDVATGGKGCPPIVAPCKYWDPDQILVDRDSRRLAYYDGFQDGVASSLQYPPTHYLKLWSSCEFPLATCQNPCGSCPPAISTGGGFVYEGGEFLIEDNYYQTDGVRENGNESNQTPAPEPVVTPEGEKLKKDDSPLIAPPQESSESGTSVRYLGPFELDDYGLASPRITAIK